MTVDQKHEYPLVVRDLTIQYANAPTPALQDVNLTVKRGEFLGIVGPTGCGKSTLLATLAGIIPHYIHPAIEGDILLQGRSTFDLSLPEFAVHVGLVLQDPDTQLFNLLVRDELVWGLENRGVSREEQLQRLRETLQFFRIEDLEDRITYDLSGGEKQRLSIGAVYINRPDVLLLDNPTSQLDPRGAALTIESIRRVLATHQTVIMVEDKIDELIEHADRLVVMDQGRIVLEGTPEEICGQLEVLERIGLATPEIPEVFERLRRQGFAITTLPLTVEDAAEALSAMGIVVQPPAQPPDSSEPTPVQPTILKVDNVSFRYPPPHMTHAVRGVSLEIAERSFVAIIGQNGSGKTTLARCISGYLTPTSGQVLIGGKNVHETPVRERAQLVGYVFQNPETQLFTNSVHEEVMFGLRNLKVPPAEAEERANEILSMLKLQDKRDTHPFRLSFGDKQRLAIATVAVLRPRVLIVDEPTTGQDYRQAAATLRVLTQLREELGITIIVITHSMHVVVEYCDRAIALCRGEVLLDGTPREVFAHEEKLRETFVEAPPVTQLAHRLGLGFVPLTVSEFIAGIAPAVSMEARP